MTASPAIEVNTAYDWCEALTRRQARNFYYGLKLSPLPQRRALYAVYAWMRRADDLVDNHQKDAEECRERIERFRVTTEAAIRGNCPEKTPLWVALTDAAQRYSLSPEHFHAMLDGQADDLQDRTYETFEQLREYCYRVASTVGLLCLEIWESEDERAKQYAIDRGIAFQLTNILRDYREDFDVGRVYLPTEDFQRQGLTAADLRAWSDPDRGQAFFLEQINRAESYYQRSAPLDAVIGKGGRSALWTMTQIYHGLLEKMRRHPERIILGNRVGLNSWHKGAIVVRARWGHRAGQVAIR